MNSCVYVCSNMDISYVILFSKGPGDTYCRCMFGFFVSVVSFIIYQGKSRHVHPTLTRHLTLLHTHVPRVDQLLQLAPWADQNTQTYTTILIHVYIHIHTCIRISYIIIIIIIICCFLNYYKYFYTDAHQQRVAECRSSKLCHIRIHSCILLPLFVDYYYKIATYYFIIRFLARRISSEHK